MQNGPLPFKTHDHAQNARLEAVASAPAQAPSPLLGPLKALGPLLPSRPHEHEAPQAESRGASFQKKISQGGQGRPRLMNESKVPTGHTKDLLLIMGNPQNSHSLVAVPQQACLEANN